MSEITTKAKAENQIENFLQIIAADVREVVIEDVAGVKYTVKTVLPAGRQILMLRALERALDDTAVRAAFDGLREVAGQSGGDKVQTLIGVARALVRDENAERVLAVLDGLVATADPKLPAPARDHFELQEALKMLLPFVGRLLPAGFIAGRSAEA